MSRAYLHSRTHLFVWSICFAFLISSLFALKFLKINEKKKRNKLACASNEPFDFLLMTTFYHTHRLIFHGINMLWYYCAIGFICCEIDTLSSLDTAIYFHFEKYKKLRASKQRNGNFGKLVFCDILKIRFMEPKHIYLLFVVVFITAEMMSKYVWDFSLLFFGF